MCGVRSPASTEQGKGATAPPRPWHAPGLRRGGRPNRPVLWALLGILAGTQWALAEGATNAVPRTRSTAKGAEVPRILDRFSTLFVTKLYYDTRAPVNRGGRDPWGEGSFDPAAITNLQWAAEPGAKTSAEVLKQLLQRLEASPPGRAGKDTEREKESRGAGSEQSAGTDRSAPR